MRGVLNMHHYRLFSPRNVYMSYFDSKSICASHTQNVESGIKHKGRYTE